MNVPPGAVLPSEWAQGVRSVAIETILEEKLIAILRLREAAHIVPVAEAIHAGGIRCLEVSLTTPGALEGITRMREALPDALIGAGTVCTVDDARRARGAGAQFLVSPITVPEIVAPAHLDGLPVLMGAFSPTEIHAAHLTGADFVKLFPASSFDPGYVAAVLAPFPRLRIVPTGGVDASNARSWLARGAVALGVGGGLTDASAIAGGDFEKLTAHARSLAAAARG